MRRFIAIITAIVMAFICLFITLFAGKAFNDSIYWLNCEKLIRRIWG